MGRRPATEIIQRACIGCTQGAQSKVCQPEDPEYRGGAKNGINTGRRRQRDGAGYTELYNWETENGVER